MAIVYAPRLGSVAARPGRRKGSCCGPGDPQCAECDDLVAGMVARIGALGALGGRRGRAVRKLAAAHASGELGELGDIDMTSFVVSESAISAESDAFDGRLNAWMLDYATAAARLPPAFVQQVDDFVTRWRKQKETFYWFQTNRLHDLINTEAEYNKIRDQFLGYGQATAIAPATVTADGKTVRADQIPPGSAWTDKIVTVAKWGGVIVGGLVVLKIAGQFGAFHRLGRAIGGGNAT